MGHLLVGREQDESGWFDVRLSEHDGECLHGQGAEPEQKGGAGVGVRPH